MDEDITVSHSCPTLDTYVPAFNFALYSVPSPLFRLVIAVSFKNSTIIQKDSKLPKVFKPVKVRRKCQTIYYIYQVEPP